MQCIIIVIFFAITHHCKHRSSGRLLPQHPYDHDSIGCRRVQSTVARTPRGSHLGTRPYLLFYSRGYEIASLWFCIVTRGNFNLIIASCTCRRQRCYNKSRRRAMSSVALSPSFYFRFGLLEAMIFRLYRRIRLRYSCNAGSNSSGAG